MSKKIYKQEASVETDASFNVLFLIMLNDFLLD